MALSDAELDKRLYKAFMEARKGKLSTVDENKFEMYFLDNLYQLREDIKLQRYKPSRSRAFINHNPVDREIFAAPFRDRVVHHFICDFIMDWWDRRLIASSYSCRKGKGTDAGIKDLAKKMRQVSQNGRLKTYVAKIDLSSYFCSIPRDKLYQRVNWGLKKQFLYDGCTAHDREVYKTLKFLCAQVIFDNPIEGVRIKGSRKDWESYPKHKSLFNQRPGVGIVIGNLTSQMFSNIYLDQLDRFVHFTLGIKKYGRYVDDAYFVLTPEQKEQFFAVWLPMIEDFLAGIGLKMNRRKTFCQDIYHGVPFLGAVVRPYNILPGKRLKRNFRRAMRDVQAGQADLETLISYLGRLQHFDSQNLIAGLFEQYGMDYNRDADRRLRSRYYLK